MAVLRTANDIVFTKLIQPIALPTADTVDGLLPALTSGWGRYQVSSRCQTFTYCIHCSGILLKTIQMQTTHSDVLKWKKTTTYSLSNCMWRLKFHKVFVHETSMCTLNPTGICMANSDAGDPLTTSETPRVLIGVASWGLQSFNQGCGGFWPDVYTRVFPFLQFIRSAMQK